MRYLKQFGDTIVEFQEPFPGRGDLLRGGWLEYNGVLPLERIKIEDGAIVELPEPAPTHEWHTKDVFVQAVTALIPEEQRQTVANQWQTIWGVAQLPGDQVNLLDPRIPAFAAIVDLSMEAIRAKISEMEGAVQ